MKTLQTIYQGSNNEDLNMTLKDFLSLQETNIESNEFETSILWDLSIPDDEAQLLCESIEIDFPQIQAQIN